MSKTVLTLIANPARMKLGDSAVHPVRERLEAQGAYVHRLDWLAPEEAVDLHLTRMTPEDAGQVAAAVLKDAPVDVVAQLSGDRRKRMLIADMDSTIITIECIDEIADFVGRKKEVSAITERAMNGELDFAQALGERVALLAGLPEATLQHVYEERLHFMPGARELVATMNASGAHTVLVSGGFDFFTSRVQGALGFALDKSNRLEVQDGKLTGRVMLPILDKNAKLQTLMEESARLGISADDILAVGDGANDLPMLLAAGFGVAYHAKPMVQASARHRINHTDLTALLFAQGYRKGEWLISE